MDVNGNVIPHLYSAGELGSMFSSIYQGTGNLGECLVFGRISGKNATQQKKDIYEGTVMNGKATIKAVWNEPEIYIPKLGEFIGNDRGIGGPLQVKVIYDGIKINSIDVIYHNETRGVSTNAIKTILDSIVKNQNIDVDTVTGATVTSKAIKNAVKDALKDTDFFFR